MDKKLFSTRLREVRKKKFKSQEAFAEKYDELYNRRDDDSKDKTILATLKNYENPKKNTIPSLEIVDRICGILECDVDYLLGRIDYKTHDNQDIASKLAISEESVEVLKYLATDIGEDFDYYESHPDMKWDFFNNAPLPLDRLICSEWFIPFLNALYNCLTVEQDFLEIKRLYEIEDKKNLNVIDYRFFSAEEKRQMDEAWKKKIAAEKEKNITLSIFDVQRISCKIAEELALASKQYLEDSNKIIAETVKNFYKARKKEGGHGI